MNKIVNVLPRIRTKVTENSRRQFKDAFLLHVAYNVAIIYDGYDLIFSISHFFRFVHRGLSAEHIQLLNTRNVN